MTFRALPALASSSDTYRSASDFQAGRCLGILRSWPARHAEPCRVYLDPLRGPPCVKRLVDRCLDGGSVNALPSHRRPDRLFYGAADRYSRRLLLRVYLGKKSVPGASATISQPVSRLEFLEVPRADLVRRLPSRAPRSNSSAAVRSAGSFCPGQFAEGIAEPASRPRAGLVPGRHVGPALPTCCLFEVRRHHEDRDRRIEVKRLPEFDLALAELVIPVQVVLGAYPASSKREITRTNDPAGQSRPRPLAPGRAQQSEAGDS